MSVAPISRRQFQEITDPAAAATSFNTGSMGGFVMTSSNMRVHLSVSHRSIPDLRFDPEETSKDYLIPAWFLRQTRCKPARLFQHLPTISQICVLQNHLNL